MLYEIKTYQVAPGCMRECLKLYADEGYEHFKPFEPSLIGYFVSEVGELNQLVQMWKFESYMQRQAMLETLRADPRFNAFIKRLTPLLQEQRSMLLTAAPFARCV
jgi:hypothetical protein